MWFQGSVGERAVPTRAWELGRTCPGRVGAAVRALLVSYVCTSEVDVAVLAMFMADMLGLASQRGLAGLRRGEQRKSVWCRQLRV